MGDTGRRDDRAARAAVWWSYGRTLLGAGDRFTDRPAARAAGAGRVGNPMTLGESASTVAPADATTLRFGCDTVPSGDATGRTMVLLRLRFPTVRGLPTMTDTLIPDREQAANELAGLRLRTDLFIDGDFRPARDGRRFVTENPATGQSITEVAEGGPADVDAAVAAARGAFESGAWSRMDPGGRKRISGLGRPDRRERPRTGPHRDDRCRQADHRHGRPRHARNGGLHPLARRGDRQALRPGGTVAGGRGRDDHSRADRGGGGDRAVELPGPDGGLEARAGARDRQQRRDQARIDDVAVAPADRRAGRRGRHPRRRPQRRDRDRATRWARRSAATRTSISSPSPGRPRSGGASWPGRPSRTSSEFCSSSEEEPAGRVRRRHRHRERGNECRGRDLLEHG